MHVRKYYKQVLTPYVLGSCSENAPFVNIVYCPAYRYVPVLHRLHLATCK